MISNPPPGKQRPHLLLGCDSRGSDRSREPVLQLSTSHDFLISRRVLRSRNDRLCLIRVSAFLRLAIDCRGYVVVSLARDDGAIGIGRRAIERSVDHSVGTTRHGAAVYVIAHRISRGSPGEVYSVLSLCCSRACHRLHGWRI